MVYIIGGKFKNRLLISPKGSAVRPTTSQLRESVFNICQHQIEGAVFLDLFAGSGAMGLESLSRGATEAIFIERDRYALEAIRENIRRLGVEESTRLFPLDFRRALAQLVKQGLVFDLIYADPPYGEGLGNEVLLFLDQHSLLKKGGRVFIEEEGLTIDSLKTLHLIKERKVGRANLTEFAPC